MAGVARWSCRRNYVGGIWIFTQQWGFAFFGFIFAAVYLRNAYRWRKQDKEHDGSVVV